MLHQLKRVSLSLSLSLAISYSLSLSLFLLLPLTVSVFVSSVSILSKNDLLSSVGFQLTSHVCKLMLKTELYKAAITLFILSLYIHPPTHTDTPAHTDTNTHTSVHTNILAEEAKHSWVFSGNTVCKQSTSRAAVSETLAELCRVLKLKRGTHTHKHIAVLHYR